MSTKANLRPNVIDFDAVDSSGCHSEEVIHFSWHSGYQLYQPPWLSGFRFVCSVNPKRLIYFDTYSSFGENLEYC